MNGIIKLKRVKGDGQVKEVTEIKSIEKSSKNEDVVHKTSNEQQNTFLKGDERQCLDLFEESHKTSHTSYLKKKKKHLLLIIITIF